MELLEDAERWMADDPDPVTRAELAELLRAGDHTAVADRMAEDVGFGTAGLRARLGAGRARMNRAVVIRASHAIAQHLRAQPALGPVVLGFDARHGSRQFAEDAAGVLAAHGLRVRFFPQPVPTPLLVYAARHLNAAAGIALTASHNPVGYGGLKLYGADAMQIVPPSDGQIADLIRAAPPASLVARQENTLGGGHAQVRPIDGGLFQNYLDELQRFRPYAPARTDLRIVYTPLHGVGWSYARQALHRAGYHDLHVVPEQAEPDPDFPTTPRPNPEEPEALDRVKELGQRLGAQLALINDPDADRLGVCVPGEDGQFQALDGNQVGILLADFLLTHAAPPVQLVSTVVSSPMLDAVARHHGAHLERTLTGFKWISRAGLTLAEQRRCCFLFGYEESYGYAIPLVRDKDGISTAVLFADLAAWCYAQGLTVLQHLEGLYRKHGLWVSHQTCLHLASDDARLERARRLLADGTPEQLAGWQVTGRSDHRCAPEARPSWLPAADLIELRLAEGGLVRLRPSGTEPKLKIYVDLGRAVDGTRTIGVQQAQAMAHAKATAQDLVRVLGLG